MLAAAAEGRRRRRRCSTTPSPSSPPPTAPRSWPPHPAAKDFVTDAHAHCKFVGWTNLDPLLQATALAAEVDAGYVELSGSNAAAFVRSARALRVWERTLALSLPGVAVGAAR